MEGKRPVRVTFLGDQGVGKTSLIASLVRPRIDKSFREKVAPKIPPVIWSHGEEIDGIQIELVDTSSKPADQNQVDQEIARSDFIFLLHDINTPLRQTITSFCTFWIPRILNIKSKIPIALIGTKRDKRDGLLFEPFKRGEELKREMIEVTTNFDEVEYLVECSVREPESMADIQELLLLTQNNVLYPRMPLSDSQLNFKPEFVCALKRIFQILDKDKDGYLTEELKFIQRICFNIECADEDVNDLMHEIKLHNPSGVVPGKGINEAGFVSLFHLILARGRTDTVWNILHHFGYSTRLQLRDDYLILSEIKPFPEGQYSVELTPETRQWLTELFKMYSKNNDLITWQQLDKMFSVVPDGSGHPWHKYGFPQCCETIPNKEGCTYDDESSAGFSSVSYESLNSESFLLIEHDPVTLRGFLGMWEMMTLLNWKLSFTYLCYLGIREEKIKYLDLLPAHERTCFLAYLVGSRKSGKSSLIRSILGKEFQWEMGVEEDAIDGILSQDEGTIYGVTDVTNDKKKSYIVIKELSPKRLKEICQTPEHIKTKPPLVDLIICTYNVKDPDSLKESLKICQDIKLRFTEPKPFLFIATKSDLLENNQLPLNNQEYKVFMSKISQMGPEPVCISNKNFQPHIGEIEKKALQLITENEPQQIQKAFFFPFSFLKWTTVISIFCLVFKLGKFNSDSLPVLGGVAKFLDSFASPIISEFKIKILEPVFERFSLKYTE